MSICLQLSRYKAPIYRTPRGEDKLGDTVNRGPTALSVRLPHLLAAPSGVRVVTDSDGEYRGRSGLAV